MPRDSQPPRMEDCGLGLTNVSDWLRASHETPFVLIKVRPEDVATWIELFGPAFRRCYITDDNLEKRSAELGISKRDVVVATLPDPGSIMAGDFGEILVYFYLAAKAMPRE